MKNWQKILCSCALAGAIAGCAATQPEPDDGMGTMNMNLTDTKGGTVYRLVGTFDLTGPASQPQTKTLTPDADALSLKVDLAPGEYTITLETGWHIERSVDGGAYETVGAVLKSPATQTFWIFKSQVTTVKYKFRIGAEDVDFGQLNLTIDVEDGSACVATQGTCEGGSITCTGAEATMRDVCAFSTDPDATKITCGNTTATIANGTTFTNGHMEAVETLADLQGRILAHFRTHGSFPVGTAPPTPAATCCAAADVYSCPANPDAWHGVAAWDELGFFSIDTAHHFVYSYVCADGQTAMAFAYGDLDCDTIEISDQLTCSINDGVPTCTIQTSDCAGD